MKKRRKKQNLFIDRICFVLSITVLGFALYFIVFNFIHINTIYKKSGVNVSGVASYEEYINNYKNLKANVIKLNEKQNFGFKDILENLNEVSSSFGMFKVQFFSNSTSLNMQELYEIEQSSINILSNNSFDETIKLLQNSKDEDFINLSLKMKQNRYAYLVDVNINKTLEKYKEATYLGFNKQIMVGQIEPDFNTNMNNMNLAIKDYILLSQILLEQVGDN